MIYETVFDQWFLDHVDPVWEDARGYPAQVLKLTLQGVKNFSSAYYESGQLPHDRPLWAWGVFPYYKHAGELWMLFDKRAAAHPFDIVREARKTLHFLQSPGYGGWEFARIFGQFDTRVTSNYKLARMLGFREEAVMRKFDGVNDFSLHARVR